MNNNLEITGNSRVCGIIGDPVVHSVSPIMHNAAFKELGLDYIYVPFKVTREDLPCAVKGLRALNITGINITIPHKVTIIPLLDEVEEFARRIGSVNVVANDNGRLIGYNTDAPGFLRALQGHGIEPKGQRVVVLGAGGAARSICFALADGGATLTVLNRTKDSVDRFAMEISDITGHPIQALKLTRENLTETMNNCDILVNATSVGMYPDIEATLIDRTMIKSHQTVVDIVYNPLKTRLLAEAEKAGAKTIGGLDMLIWQGALAFEIWTRRQAPVNIMRKRAFQFLKSHER